MSEPGFAPSYLCIDGECGSKTFDAYLVTKFVSQAIPA
jgi:hypothetical protein